jgi:hypothetical protein
MDEKPTVQMDSFSYDDRDEETKTPATIPIDDMHQQEWSAPPPPPPPSPPAQQPVSPPPFAPPPPPPQPAPAVAGATMIMGPAAPPPLLAWLAVTEGPGANRGQVFTLERETLIGRAAGQITLSGDPHVSAQHAKVRLEPSEKDEEEQVFVLYDLASRNGTFAGDKEEYRDHQVYRHELTDGDYILVGETTLVFKQV